MRVTIIRDDNAVTVDGVRFEVGAVALLAADIHAIQWSGKRGEIEFAYVVCDHCGSGAKKPNEAFTDFAPYQPLVDAWSAAKVAHEAERARIVAEQEATAAEAAKAAEPQA